MGKLHSIAGQSNTRLNEIYEVVVIVLLFYVHSKHLWSCQDGQLTFWVVLNGKTSCYSRPE